MGDFNVVAFDPGETTGYAGYFEGKFTHGQFPPKQTWAVLRALTPNVIIIEKFVFRQQKTKVNYTPLEVIGRIRQWAEENDVPIAPEFTLSQVKHFFSDRRLKELGMWFTGEQHARDAARHLLYWREFGDGRSTFESVIHDTRPDTEG